MTQEAPAHGGQEKRLGARGKTQAHRRAVDDGRREAMSMHVVVAGGTGVFGQANVPALCVAGHQVRTTARGLAFAPCGDHP